MNDLPGPFDDEGQPEASPPTEPASEGTLPEETPTAPSASPEPVDPDAAAAPTVAIPAQTPAWDSSSAISPPSGLPRWIIPTVVLLAAIILGSVALVGRLTNTPEHRLAAAAAHYAEAKSYTSQGTVTVDLGSGEATNSVASPFSLSYAAPNQFVLEHGETSDHVRTVSDGTDVYCQIDPLKLVVKAPAPKDLTALPDIAALTQFDLLGGDVPTVVNLASGAFQPGDFQVTGGAAEGGVWAQQQPAPRGTSPITVESKAGVKTVVWLGRDGSVAQLAAELTGEPLLKAIGLDPAQAADPRLAEQLKTARLRLLLTYTEQSFAPAAEGTYTFKMPEGFDQSEIDELTRDALMSEAMSHSMKNPPADAPQEPDAKDLTGQAPGDFEAQTMDGQKVKLSSLKGQPIVIDFWATWCPPCRESMPILNSVYQALKAQGVQVLGVSIDEKQETVQEFLKENSYDFDIWWLDPQTAEQVSAAYGISGIPRTIYIGKDWTVKEDATGLHPKEDVIKAFGKLGLEVSGVK